MKSFLIDHWLYLLAANFILVSSLLSIKQWFKQRKITQWKNHFSLTKHQATFEALYASIDGFALSKLARKNHDAPEYTYGEIEFLPFIALLSLVKFDNDTVFYDLGSGTGKAVVACAMIFPLKKYCGIEHFETLHLAARQALQGLPKQPEYKKNTQSIVFKQANFLQTDLNDAHVIFINATALIGETWDTLNQKLNDLSSCHTIITTSKPLTAQNYKVAKTTKMEVSWGVVSVYIHQRQ